MKYKLVALDIDGTLLNRQSRVGPRTREAMARAAKLGVRFILCTGRRYRTTVPVMKDLHLELCVIVNSGAMVKHSGDHRTLYRNGMTQALALAVIDSLKADGLMPTLFTDDYPNGPDFYVESDQIGNPYYLRYLANNRDAYAVVRNFSEAPADRLIEVTVFDSAGKLELPMRHLQERFGDAITTNIVRFSKHGDTCDCLEVLNRGATKWNALLHLAQEWKIAPEEIVAAGDQLNDLDMVKNAGLGVAMGNAVPELKAAADLVTASCDEDGIGILLEELFGLTGTTDNMEAMPGVERKGSSEEFPP